MYDKRFDAFLKSQESYHISNALSQNIERENWLKYPFRLV